MINPFFGGGTEVRKLWFIIPTVLGAVLALAANVQAQYGTYYDTGQTRRPFNIHAGAAFLTGKTNTSTTPIVGVEYEFPLLIDRQSNDEFFTLDTDYMAIDTLTNGTVSVVPLLAGYRAYGIIGSYRGYFEISAGIRWASNNIPELQINDGAQFGWGLTAGINLTRSFFVQSRYLAGSHPNNDGVITAELGYRF